jgi:hypothetical protein
MIYKILSPKIGEILANLASNYSHIGIMRNKGVGLKIL